MPSTKLTLPFPARMVSLDTHALDPNTSDGSNTASADYWRTGLNRLLDIDASVDYDDEQTPQWRLTNRRVGYLTITQVEGPPHHTDVRPCHPSDVRHAAAMVWVHEEGIGSITQDGIRIPLNPQTVSLSDASHPRSVTYATKLKMSIVRVPFEPLRQALNGFQVALPLSFDATQGAGGVFADFIRSIVRRCDEPNGTLGTTLAEAATRLLGVSLTCMPEGAKALPSQLEHFHKARIKAYVAEHLRDAALDIRRIGAAIGLSRRYIHQLYANEPLPLMKWVWSERLEGARTDLQRSVMRNHAISEIAFSWGFSDPAHFSRSFKRRFGISPMAVRRDAAVRIEARSARPLDHGSALPAND
jgi:AraC family transcriptional regulator, positive regulator of tynA and feaB